jgi:hypothetical protein
VIIHEFLHEVQPGEIALVEVEVEVWEGLLVLGTVQIEVVDELVEQQAALLCVHLW